MKHQFLKPAIAFALAIALLTNVYAQAPLNPKDLPSVMRFCGPLHCGTLTKQGDSALYLAVFDGQKPTAIETRFTVESFTGGSVRIKRTETGLKEPPALLTGTISSEGDRVLNGKQEYYDDKGKVRSVAEFKLGWVQPLSAKGQPMPYSEIQDTPGTRDIFLGLLMMMMAPSGDPPANDAAERQYDRYRREYQACGAGAQLAVCKSIMR